MISKAAAWLVLALPALLPLPGCSDVDSVVFVSVAADPPVAAVQLRVTADNRGDQQVRAYPPEPRTQAITFPATFTLLLPHARAGELLLDVEALDRQATVVASGRAGGSLVGGGRLDLTVTLQRRAPPPPPPPDAGSDAARPDGPVSTACTGPGECPPGYD